jgi:hypothetical protein
MIGKATFRADVENPLREAEGRHELEKELRERRWERDDILVPNKCPTGQTQLCHAASKVGHP